MPFLSISLNIENKKCLVVGVGSVGTRRAKILLKAGAIVHIIDPLGHKFENEFQHSSMVSYRIRKWKPVDLMQDYELVVAATNDKETNQTIALLCHEKNIQINNASDPILSTFTFPHVVERTPFTITVSSGGTSPLVGRLLAERVSAFLPMEYGQLAVLFGKFREQIQRILPNPQHRKKFWKDSLSGNIAEEVFRGNLDKAENLFIRSMDEAEHKQPMGEVYLIGAGPGDHDLLTFRAFRLLQQSDTIVYDRLVSQAILDKVSAGKEMIYVGKERSNHRVSQPRINQILVDIAKQGKKIARLKGGDPFIFGRGGEEIELLAENAIPFQIVPGITAASGCASYAGIPLTHRDYAQSVCFVTGQLKNGAVNLPWQQLVAPNQTVVIYMGLNGLSLISEKLIENGMSTQTPAALIEQGTKPSQKIHISTVLKLPTLVDSLYIQPPTLLIIGEVVKLHTTLNWYRSHSENEFS